MTITKRIAAPPENVFDSCTQPDLLSTWFTTSAVVVLRIGGSHFNGDGDRGTILEIDRPGHIGFSWDNPGHSPGTTVDIRIENDGEGSTVSLTHSGLNGEKEREDMKTGWTWALDSLASYLEKGERIWYKDWDPH